MAKLTPSFGDPWGEMLVALGGPARHELTPRQLLLQARSGRAKERQLAQQAVYRARKRLAKLAAAEPVPKLSRSAAQQARRDRDRIAHAARRAQVKAPALALKPANKPKLQLMFGQRRRGG